MLLTGFEEVRRLEVLQFHSADPLCSMHDWVLFVCQVRRMVFIRASSATNRLVSLLGNVPDIHRDVFDERSMNIPRRERPARMSCEGPERDVTTLFEWSTGARAKPPSRFVYTIEKDRSKSPLSEALAAKRWLNARPVRRRYRATSRVSRLPHSRVEASLKVRAVAARLAPVAQQCVLFENDRRSEIENSLTLLIAANVPDKCD